MRGYGLDPFVADVRAVDVPVLELRDRAEEVLDTLEEEARRAMDAGADALVLGCMTMGFLDAAKDLQERVGIPVVNPVLTALRTAESTVALGLSHSRRAYPVPRKPGAAMPIGGSRLIEAGQDRDGV